MSLLLCWLFGYWVGTIVTLLVVRLDVSGWVWRSWGRLTRRRARVEITPAMCSAMTEALQPFWDTSRWPQPERDYPMTVIGDTVHVRVPKRYRPATPDDALFGLPYPGRVRLPDEHQEQP